MTDILKNTEILSINNFMIAQNKQPPARPTDEHCSLFVFGSLTIIDPDTKQVVLKTQA